MPWFTVAALALSVGLVLGALGGGGALLALPILVTVAKVEPRAAIATSLIVVAATSLVAAAIHARRGAVCFRVGGLFGGAAAAAAFLAGRFSRFVPAKVLLAAFGIVTLAAALAMLRGRHASTTAGTLRPARAIVLGLSVGALSGMVGAGGGFLIVPALVLFGGLAMPIAIGTSLFVISLQSLAGFAGHVGHVALDHDLVAVVTAPAVVGTAIGATLGARLRSTTLRTAFAWFVLSMALVVITPLLSRPFAAPIALAVVVLAVSVARKAPKESSSTASSLRSSAASSSVSPRPSTS
jgi:uncharacterized membrane protein YfcA